MSSPHPASPPVASLKARATKRLAITLAVLALLLFLSAGTFRFWQAWLFVVMQAVLWTYFFYDFLKNDPQLVERRLHARETETEQKWFQRLWVLITIPGFVLAGFDFRFG